MGCGARPSRVATMPRDLRRHVGAERRHLAGLGLDEAKHVRRIERAQAALEDLGQLERGRRDQAVAVQVEVIEHHAAERAAPPRLLRQEIAEARGQRVREGAGAPAAVVAEVRGAPSVARSLAGSAPCGPAVGECSAGRPVSSRSGL